MLETQYCVTLDKVPESLYPAITKNKNQRDEWVKLFAIDQWNGDSVDGSTAYSKPLKPEFLKENPWLVLDTRHFDRGFTDKLLDALSEAGPIEEQMNGLLVHGENYHALNLLQDRYRGQVQCVYIDPPYNTGDSEILYKNGYLQSSWLSLMANRLAMVFRMLAPDSVLYIAIDDFEMVNLAKLLDTEHPSLRREMIIVNHHPQGGKSTVLANTHEYMLVCIPTSSDRTLVGRATNSEVELRPFRRSGTAESNFRYARPNSFYAILVHPESSKVMGSEPPPNKNEYPTEPTEEGLIRIYPVSSQGEERVWRRSYESGSALISNQQLRCSNKNTIYQAIQPYERTPALFSNWTDTRYNAGTFGANLLRDIIGEQNTFPYPKSIHTVEDAIFAVGLKNSTLVLDYFAGSGTTGHAVINLNREDGGDRKYVLVEIGHHFEDVLLPRMKKVIYAEKWKDGKPEDRNGVSQLLRYIRLESYEDALDSLTLNTRDDIFDNEDYQLRYALGDETKENASLLGKDFIDPHDYTLSVVRDGVRRDMPVDLAETFNFLLGLRLTARRKIDDVLTIQGTNSKGENCLILWRNLQKMNASELDKWFTKHCAKFSDDLNLIYVNGDHTLNALRKSGDQWEAVTTEPVFRELMFAGAG